MNGGGHGKRNLNDTYEMDSSIKHQISLFKAGYARVKEFADHYYPDIEIISINPIGLQGLFKDIYM